MNDLEHIINRYLDGELDAAELQEFQQLLDSSPEARKTLGNLELIRSAARSFPDLSVPDPTLESALFQELFAEEDWAPQQEEEERRRGVIFPIFRSGIESIAAIGIGRAALALPAILLLLLLGDRFLGSDQELDGGQQIAAVAEGLSPRTESGSRNLFLSTGPVAEPRRDETPANAESEGSAQSQSLHRTTLNGVDRGDMPTSSPERSGREGKDPRANSVEEEGASSQVLPNAFAVDSQSHPDQDQRDRPQVTPQRPRQEPTTEFADNTAQRDPLPAFDRDDFERPEKESDRPSILSASYRHGVATFFGERENVLASGQDLNLRVDGRLAERHRLSVVVGSSPLLVSERTYTVHTSVAPVDPKGPKTPQTASVTTEESNRAEGEIWAGVGYGYTLFEGKRVRLEAGLNAGLGEQSTRYGVELPTRITVTDRIGIDFVPYVTRIVPRDQDIHDREIISKNFDQSGEEWTPSSTSVGAQIGLSLSLY